MQLGDLDAHLDPQGGIQVGQGFIEQEHLRLLYDGTADGHPLALTAGEGLGLSVQQGFETQDLGGTHYPLVDILLVHLLELEAEGHVLVDVHVGVEGVGLEHHAHVAFHRRHVVHVTTAYGQLTAGDVLQPCDHPQQSGFAATGRADEDDELPFLDGEVDVAQRVLVDRRIVVFANVVEYYFSHDELRS